MIMLYVFDGIIVLTAGYMCFTSFFHKNIIHKKYISDTEKEVWGGDISKSFPIWDPMGSLA